MIDFKGMHFPKDVIFFAVFFYLRYPVSYRDLEDIMEERGVDVDHGTLNRWVVKFAPLMAVQAQSRKKPTAVSWRMDETYIKVKGKWRRCCRDPSGSARHPACHDTDIHDAAQIQRFPPPQV